MRRSRRRTKINASSLDLFLDTICNAFGGIMFLSILIAVLAQLRDSQQSKEPVDEALSQSEVDDFSHKLEELQSEYFRPKETQKGSRFKNININNLE